MKEKPIALNLLVLIHLINKNINLNNLQEKITVITNPLAAVDEISNLFLDKLDTGASEVFLEEKFIQKSKKKKKKRWLLCKVLEFQ